MASADKRKQRLHVERPHRGIVRAPARPPPPPKPMPRQRMKRRRYLSAAAFGTYCSGTDGNKQRSARIALRAPHKYRTGRPFESTEFAAKSGHATGARNAQHEHAGLARVQGLVL
ncbi:hypothetical protein TRVL_05460 [Trypanosoma vivax]|nr:hypothetical protein TRVL_05460 [Trypanosoma vivax]